MTPSTNNEGAIPGTLDCVGASFEFAGARKALR